MQALLRRLKELPISLATVKQYAPDGCRVLLYDDLPSSREQLFKGGVQSAIIFYEMHDQKGRPQDDKAGHFSLVINRPKIRYFSSYGFRPEREINLTKSEAGKLLKILGKNFEWNRTRYQAIRHTATCALHCLARAYLLNLSEEKYKKIIFNRVVLQNSDLIVCIMCLLLVRNELFSE